ncbi:hypothetical protein ACFQE7_13670 [Nonomuraea ferruginea]|uniref:hypothetical protein n=1 Tax=Nonomuraea ferruginea TaxID=46174 RepID=UPI00361F3AED
MTRRPSPAVVPPGGDGGEQQRERRGRHPGEHPDPAGHAARGPPPDRRRGLVRCGRRG